MVTAAAALATLAREAAEDVFDAMTADCTEPMRPERVRTNMPKPTVGSITQLTTDPAAPLPRYTPVLVADPTPPLPHAAPAPAAEAGDIAAWVARATAIEIERADAEARAEAAEAERDRLSAEVANAKDWQRIAMGFQSEAEVLRADFEAAEAGRAELVLEVAALRGELSETREMAAERDAALEENAALRGAMPDPDQLAHILADDEDGPARAFARLERLEAAIRAALATATPTPPAAEAVTGDVPLGGWRDPLTALDTPQEADHAAR